MRNMKINKTLAYFLILLLMLVFACGCIVLQHFVDVRTETAAAVPPRPEKGDMYNNYGLKNNAELSDEIVAASDGRVVFTDRILILEEAAAGSAQYAAETARAILSAVPEIDGIYIMPIPERAVFEKGFESFRASYGAFISELTSAVGVGVTVIDPVSELDKHSDEFIFYRTENSWTMRGAFYAMQAFRVALGYKPADLNAYRTYMLGDFYGDAYSAVHSNTTDEELSEVLSLMPSDPFYIYLIGSNPNRETLTFENKNDEIQTEKRRTIQLNGYGPSAVIGGSYLHSVIDGRGEGSILFITDSAGDMLISYLSEIYEKIYAVSVLHDKSFSQDIADICERYDIHSVLWAQLQPRLGNRSYMRALNGLDGAA